MWIIRQSRSLHAYWHQRNRFIFYQNCLPYLVWKLSTTEMTKSWRQTSRQCGDFILYNCMLSRRQCCKAKKNKNRYWGKFGDRHSALLSWLWSHSKSLKKELISAIICWHLTSLPILFLQGSSGSYSFLPSDKVNKEQELVTC